MDRHNGKDFLTKLPEDIITHVLSLLPAKDAFRTCLLSKAWEYRWTKIHKIEIRDGNLLAERAPDKDDVIQFVDKFLFFSRTLIITMFRLFLFHHCYNPVRIATWITTVLLRNVKNLQIDYNHEGVILPRFLFQCTSITKLKLRLPCIFRVPVTNSFPSLKILHLFPVLETPRLGICKWLKLDFVDIKVPSLTNLIVNEIELISLCRPTTQSCLVKLSGSKSLSFDYCRSGYGRFDMRDSSVLSTTLKHSDVFGLHDQGFGRNCLHAKMLLAGYSGNLPIKSRTST